MPSYQSLKNAFIYPPMPWLGNIASTIVNSTALATVGQKVALIGQVFWEGRPASAKTVSSAGGTIGFLSGTTTWANASSTLRLGFQSVSASGGIPAQPDGSWSGAYIDIVPGTTAIASSAWNNIALATGSSSLTHGDYVAIVFDLTAKAGSDSVVIASKDSLSQSTVNYYNGSAWLTLSVGTPCVTIVADDGTIGTFVNTQPFTLLSGVGSYSDSSNPDSFGIIFRTPFGCKCSGAQMACRFVDNTANALISLYSDPLALAGGPTLMASATVTAKQQAAANTHRVSDHEFSEQALAANTDYALVVKATAAGSFRLGSMTVNSSDFLTKLISGSLRGCSQNNATGAFTEIATSYYFVAARLSALDVGGGVIGAGNLTGGLQ